MLITRSGLAGLLLGLSTGLQAAQRVELAVTTVPEEFARQTAADTGTVAGVQAISFLVVGTIRWPSFAVPGVTNLQVTDARGQPLPLIVDRSSLFFEFGELRSVRVAFELPVAALAAGLPRLAWGPDVNASNRVVARLSLAARDRPRLRTFTAQADTPAGRSEPQFAAVEVIADSQADRYYLWYLLPVAVLFGLLAARKVLLR